MTDEKFDTNSENPVNSQKELQIKHVDAMLEHAKELTKTEQDLAKEYFKSLWTFSSGALALSVTLVSGVFGSRLTHFLTLLYISWALYGVCILFTMLSVRLTQKAFQVDRNDIYDQIRDKGLVSRSSKCHGWVVFAEALEIAAGVLFLAGIVFLIVFVIKNLGYGG